MSSDNAFGPQVNTSIRPFDLTLLFEDSILSVLPSVLLSLLAPARIVYLYKKRRKVIWPSLAIVKRWVLVVLCSFQITVLALWALPSSPKSTISILSASFGVVDAFTISFLSALEHSHSARPSLILNVYLLFSTIFDVVRARTLWLIGSDLTLSIMFTLSTSLKAILLVLESKEKRRHLLHNIVGYVAENTSGIYSKIFFWWLNPLFLKGFKSTVSANDLSLVSTQLWESSSSPQTSPISEEGMFIRCIHLS
jgi:ATP-binding cassette, subfamily C (CFTR/MRP), member 1